MRPGTGKIQVGVKNMFNAGPSLESDGFTYDEDLYSIDGRIYYRLQPEVLIHLQMTSRPGRAGFAQCPKEVTEIG
jgi:hypothetical protein